MRLALFLLAALSAQAAVVEVPAGASLSSALRKAQAGDTLVLADFATYKLPSEVGTARWPGEVVITSKTPRLAVLDCSANCYVSGALNLTLRELQIRGRINLDGVGYWEESGEVAIVDNLWLAGDGGWTEALKAAHIKGLRIEGNVFWRDGSSARDRLVDLVGVDSVWIMRNAFVNALQGAIQVKGGSENGFISENYVLWGGQRAIQIGGSTCWDEASETGCWGRRKDGSAIRPEDVGYEAINWQVSDNVVVCDGSCVSLSTQYGSKVMRNTFYMPVATGGQWFVRLLQETEPQVAKLLKPSGGAELVGNAWLYPVTRADGKGGVNSSLLNFTDRYPGDYAGHSWEERTGQDVASFRWARNAFYALTPVVEPGFGNRPRPVYPHRHPNGSAYWNPFTWRNEWFDQVPAGVLDWGLPSMTLTAAAYEGIGAKGPTGPDWWTPPPELLPAPPPELADYPPDQPLYGWEGPGSAPPAEPNEPPEPEPTEPPVSELFILRLPSGEVRLFETRGAAEGWVGGIEIERVERKP